jgi:hypothetical protein
VKKSRNVITGVVLSASLAFAASGLAACADDDDTLQDSDYSEVCVNQNYERVPEDQCDDDDRRTSSGLFWMFFPRSYTVPPYGGTVSKSHGFTSKPATGTTGRVPAKGGFGTFRGGGGS